MRHFTPPKKFVQARFAAAEATRHDGGGWFVRSGEPTSRVIGEGPTAIAAWRDAAEFLMKQEREERRPKSGDYACGSCGRPVRLDQPEPARLCCKKIWHLAGGVRRGTP